VTANVLPQRNDTARGSPEGRRSASEACRTANCEQILVTSRRFMAEQLPANRLIARTKQRSDVHIMLWRGFSTKYERWFSASGHNVPS
jgi:hypothetical protein